MNFQKLIPVLMLTLAFGGLAISPSRAQFSDTYDFMQAVVTNDISVARTKILEGANVNGRRDGSPVFIIALKKGYYEMVRLLLENGAYVNMPALPNQETALMVVSTTGDEIGTRLILEFNPDLNAPDRIGQTALMKAAASGKTSVVRLLIEAGADVFQTDYVGRDAMQYALEARARNIVKLLEEAGVN